MNNNEEQAVDEEEEGGEAWQRLSKKRKSEMSADELHTYFDCQLRGVHECPNLGCNCIAILGDTDMRVLVVKYLCWFNAKTKYEQDLIVFEWFKYSSHLKKSKCKSNYFKLPFIDDGTADVPQGTRTHVLCSWGLLLVLNWGKRRWGSIQKASLVTGVSR